MKWLDVYTGSGSIANEARRQGHEAFGVDHKQYRVTDLVIDVEELTIEMLPWIPDVVWFGIPCTSWSLAGIGAHRINGTIAVSDFAKKSDRLLDHNLKLILDLQKINPDLIWYFENPRGCLRKMPQMKGLPRATVWYCQYGDSRAKPTDIWSNNIVQPLFETGGWRPRPKCYNGNVKCHHEAAPRGSKTGTQGLKDNHERSKMPEALCREIVEQTTHSKKVAISYN